MQMNELPLWSDNKDNIEIKLQIDKNEDGYNTLECYVFINDKPVDIFCDFTEFLLSSKDNRNYYDKKYYPTHKELDYSSFEPFTCSCGISGCAGVFDGIYTKYRKYSVEWRIPKGCGYESILDKTFYSFDRRQYQSQIDNLWKFLEDNKDVLVYDSNNDGYWDEGVDDWVEQITFVKLGEQYKWLYKEKL